MRGEGWKCGRLVGEPDVVQRQQGRRWARGGGLQKRFELLQERRRRLRLRCPSPHWLTPGPQSATGWGAPATCILLQWYPLVKAVAIKGPPRLWPKPVLGAGLAALM